MKPIIRSLIWTTIYLVAIIGLCWQVYEISLGYFSYNVSTVISFSLTKSNEDKAINLRFFYYELFDKELYTKDTNESIAVHTSPLDMYYTSTNFTDNVTVDQIMKYTPEAKDINEYCLHISIPDCDPNKSVIYEKYVVNLFVVYRFIFPNNSSTIYDETVFYKPIHYSTISAIGSLTGRKTSFNNAYFVSLFLNPINEIPYTEHAIAINTDTEYNYTTKVQHSLAFGLRGHSIITYKLEPPYITKCIKNYNFYDCFSNCVNNFTVNNLNRLALLKYHTGGDMKQVTASDLRNSSIDRMYQSYLD